jgi:methionyl-tRNA formyltransferase
MKKKTIIILITTILISTSIIFYLLVLKEKKRNQKAKSNEILNSYSEKIEQAKRKIIWLEENLKFENKIRSILRKSGYTLKQANDSLIADQDRIYFGKDSINFEQVEWYKEHRKDLIEFPQKVKELEASDYK